VSDSLIGLASVGEFIAMKKFLSILKEILKIIEICIEIALLFSKKKIFSL
jgi:hypothetical protein